VLSPSREGQETSLPQLAETAAPTAVVTTFDVVVGVVGEAGPSSPRSVAAGADEVLVTGELTADLQERVAP
jgi:hypothetical protein